MNKQEIEKAIKTLKSCHAWDCDDEWALDLAISALEQQLANRWIPTTEKLPEDNAQRVLVTLKNEMVLEVWYINNAFEFHETLGGGLEKVSDFNPVIAWRPLPEPYKGN